MTKIHSKESTVWDPSGLSISAEPLAAFPYLRHASTTRDFSTPGLPRIQELLKVRQYLDAPASFLAFADQQHTNNVGLLTAEIVAEHRHRGHYSFPGTDAIVCPLKNVTIAIQTADCAPVFLFDPVKQVIALAHAGWKGTLSRITENTIRTMENAGSSPADIISWVGPMAGGCCYEVSEELANRFLQEFTELAPDVVARGRYLDLVEVNCKQLEHAGVTPENVHRSNLCTIHHRERFHSYRADSGSAGRIISAMVMLEQL